ncbi:hypothetical protein RFM68_15530 [Mesorhizobium sp. MSK_1335]|uniref:NrtR DNA-binding winged helix domain-containing protein n=1 Tax=Mesorhizobium montanum TaxID=3072323 RepID=A0ABU4ZKJ8_9HYPH|nr:hypothetical protein [Mesorhizobium sp. MSK_1335]MDX8525918.1 hypothetical protein [Mesorhizobium sp. MSK_1335]
MKQPPKADQRHSITAELIAVLVAVTTGQPRVMTVENGKALPSGPFELGHRSLQSGLRDWVEQQTRHPLGYIEQLYTFADRDRAGDEAQRVISISYLALAREEQAAPADEATWRNWYNYFPWEDHRDGVPPALPGVIVPGLNAWAKAADNTSMRSERQQRTAIAFGLDGHGWNEELVLQRYELLYEAALVEEAHRSRAKDLTLIGPAMAGDHRRILATGIARLRAKIKYRPVVFELMPPVFTLLQLQRSVEALAGRLVHKPNFRRLIEQQELVEETGTMTADMRGRPAKLFRFRHDVLAERAVAGTKLPVSRA